MFFNATKVRVTNRDVPPDEFLTELVQWGRSAPDEIFAPRSNPNEPKIDPFGERVQMPDPDIYAQVKPILGPWTDLSWRRACLLEVMRVHAGFESSWNWNEGVDVTNETSMSHITGQETGIFQVSFDSEWIDHAFMKPFAVEHGIDTPETFIPKMKSYHALALEYYARLVRVNIRWAGPLVRHEIDPWLSRASAHEFQQLLS